MRERRPEAERVELRRHAAIERRDQAPRARGCNSPNKSYCVSNHSQLRQSRLVRCANVPSGIPEHYDAFATARRSPTSREPRGMQRMATVAPQLSTSVTVEHDRRLGDGAKRDVEQRVLQPDDEHIVNEIHAVGVVAQTLRHAQAGRSKPQKQRQSGKTAGGARQARG